jgi:hypothetical protein
MVRKGVNKHKRRSALLGRVPSGTNLHWAWSKAHLRLNALFKEVARAC